MQVFCLYRAELKHDPAKKSFESCFLKKFAHLQPTTNYHSGIMRATTVSGPSFQSFQLFSIRTWNFKTALCWPALIALQRTLQVWMIFPSTQQSNGKTFHRSSLPTPQNPIRPKTTKNDWDRPGIDQDWEESTTDWPGSTSDQLRSIRIVRERRGSAKINGKWPR